MLIQIPPREFKIIIFFFCFTKCSFKIAQHFLNNVVLDKLTRLSTLKKIPLMIGSNWLQKYIQLQRLSLSQTVPLGQHDIYHLCAPTLATLWQWPGHRSGGAALVPCLHRDSCHVPLNYICRFSFHLP